MDVDRDMERGAACSLASSDATASEELVSSESHPSISCVCSSTRVLDREEDADREETRGILDGPASDCTVVIIVGVGFWMKEVRSSSGGAMMMLRPIEEDGLCHRLDALVQDIQGGKVVLSSGGTRT